MAAENKSETAFLAPDARPSWFVYGKLQENAETWLCGKIQKLRKKYGEIPKNQIFGANTEIIDTYYHLFYIIVLFNVNDAFLYLIFFVIQSKPIPTHRTVRRTSGIGSSFQKEIRKFAFAPK